MSLFTFRIAIWYIVLYLDFPFKKRALWLVDSWSRALDQIQMYPDRDTILQLLPARRIQQHDFAKWLLKGKSNNNNNNSIYLNTIKNSAKADVVVNI